jgi:hypothetical protein
MFLCTFSKISNNIYLAINTNFWEYKRGFLKFSGLLELGHVAYHLTSFQSYVSLCIFRSFRWLLTQYLSPLH